MLWRHRVIQSSLSSLLLPPGAAKTFSPLSLLLTERIALELLYLNTVGFSGVLRHVSGIAERHSADRQHR